VTELAIAVVAFVAGLTAFVFLNSAMERRGHVQPHFRRWDSSTSKLRRAEMQPSADELAEMVQQLERLETMRRSPLSRVVGVGATLEDDGITVEFLAIELRAAGGRATYRVRAPVTYRGDPAPESPWRSRPQPRVVDDVGTEYATGLSSWGGWGGGEEYSESAVDFVFTPSPPATATSLRISVPYLDPSGGRPDLEHGPWVFDVPL
jgi:hypothetical protein